MGPTPDRGKGELEIWGLLSNAVGTWPALLGQRQSQKGPRVKGRTGALTASLDSQAPKGAFGIRAVVPALPACAGRNISTPPAGGWGWGQVEEEKVGVGKPLCLSS